MDNQEVRDELARLMGWTHTRSTDPAIEGCPPCWEHTDGRRLFHGAHPVPNTMDAADAAMPDGWDWERFRMADTNLMWEATCGARRATVLDTGNKKTDLFNLALASRKAAQ